MSTLLSSDHHPGFLSFPNVALKALRANGDHGADELAICMMYFQPILFFYLFSFYFLLRI